MISLSATITSVCSSSKNHGQNAQKQDDVPQSAAYRCLSIDEILRPVVALIYDEGRGQGTLAALAQSNSIFVNVALEAQWHSLPSIGPIIQVLRINVQPGEESYADICLKQDLVCAMYLYLWSHAVGYSGGLGCPESVSASRARPPNAQGFRSEMRLVCSSRIFSENAVL